MAPYNSLASCVESLSASVNLLDESFKTLDEAAHDLSRLQKVLSISKVFGLVPELDLENAKQNVRKEVEPQISNIITKVQNEVSKLERKKMNLVSKVDLQQVRLETFQGSSRDSIGRGVTFRGRVVKGSGDELKVARLKLLQNKKERLKYSLSRLNLQQRLSMIPSLPPQ